PARGPGALDGDRPTVEEQLAVVGLEHPRDDLDQGRLPGAVVPDDGVDLPVPQLEAGPAKRRHVAEALDDVPGLEEGNLVRHGGDHRTVTSTCAARGVPPWRV